MSIAKANSERERERDTHRERERERDDISLFPRTKPEEERNKERGKEVLYGCARGTKHPKNFLKCDRILQALSHFRQCERTAKIKWFVTRPQLDSLRVLQVHLICKIDTTMVYTIRKCLGMTIEIH